MIFKYSEYKNFLALLKSNGRAFTFSNWTGQNGFLIRHDIDFCLDLASVIAEIEHSEGIKSTYFIMCTCADYNVLHEKARRNIEKIMHLGHEIGLHFDPTVYPEKEINYCMQKEVENLEFICKKSVKSVSLHNPSLHGNYPIFEGYFNAYDPKIFSDENYISDSCFSFRGKNIFEFIERADNMIVQILTHPIHYSDDGSGYGEIISKKIIRDIKRIQEHFSANETFNKQTGNDFFDFFKKYLCEEESDKLL